MTKKKVDRVKELRKKFPNVAPIPEIESEFGVDLLEPGGLASLGSKLTVQQLRFLEHYAQTMDIHESVKAAGYSDLARAKRSLLTNDWINAEMQEVERRYRLKWKLSPDMVAAKHIELMNKFEKAFDDGNDKMANPLAKMSETALKATGQLDKENNNKVVPITVNINIGDDDKVVTVDGKVNDTE